MKRVFSFLGRGLTVAVLVAFGAAGLVGAGGCGATGGSEAGNPSRSVLGSLATADGAALTADQASASAATGCPADIVVAVDSRKQEQTFEIGSDCSFSLDLLFNKAYSIQFRLGAIDVGSMVFQNSPDRFPSPVMELAEEETDVSLGVVVLNDGHSKPENEPAAQNDADLDGIPDSVDTDDDNDGILDVDEPDCDLDGIIDDFDDDNVGCPLVKAMPDDKVLEVLPRNGSGIDAPQDAVAADIGVQIRFSCAVDEGSINVDTFVVASQDAPGNLLKCDLSVSDEKTSATCLPEGLAPDTAYTATIRSVRCVDGQAIASTTWTWRTAAISDAATETQVPTAEPEKIPSL